MKKIFVIMMCIIMVIAMMPVMAFAESDEQGTIHTVSTWAEFQEKLGNASDGDTIQLINSITAEDSDLAETNGNVYIRKNIVLDLNNFELKIGTNGTGYLYVYQGIKIINGSIKGRFYSYNNDVIMEKCNIESNYDYNSAVTVNNASFTATDCTFKSTGTGSGCYAVVFTNGTNETLSLKNCKLEANNEGALNYCGSSSNANIENCEIKSATTSSSSGAIRIYSSNGQNNLTVTNTTISNSGEGRAVYVQLDNGAEINFGDGNIVTGKVTLKGGTNNSYKFNVTGGQFKNGTDSSFDYDNIYLLNITGGLFAADVETLIASGYTCVKTDNNSEYPYEVIVEGDSTQPFYTQNGETKTYYDTFAEAVADVKGTTDTIYLKSNVEITDDNIADLNGLTLKGRAGINITYSGTVSDFIEQVQNITISDSTINFSDVTLSGMVSESGKLTGGKGLTASNYQTCASLLSENSLIDASSYEINSADNYSAKIGVLGYAWLGSAISEAVSNDADTPVNDEIVLLKSVSYYATPVLSIEEQNENAAFTIDFNGYSMETEHFNACVIINCSNVDITFKNGSITANDNIAIATNGQREGINLKLENMNVKSGTAAALYMAGDGKTEIVGGTYEGVTGIEIRAGELNISDNPEITGGNGELTVVKNDGGSTTSNAALAVVQHTTKKTIKVVIESGTFNGSAAVNEADPQENNPTNVTIEIKDGSFIGSVNSVDCTEFISGGKYSEKPQLDYIANDNVAIAYTSSDETNYYVGTEEQINEKAEEAKSGDAIEVIKGDIALQVAASGVKVSNTGRGIVTVNDVNVEEGNTVTTAGSYTPIHSTIQKPIIEAGEGAEVNLNSGGNTATIIISDGYKLVDVTVNGVSKGTVTTLTGLKTGDKVVVTTEKLLTETELLKLSIDNIKLAARSKLVTLKNGKKAVKITWKTVEGEEVEFDGVEIYRSVKRYSGYGKKPIYTSKSGRYFNTAIKTGTKYYYKVRGYVMIDGQKYYTSYSLKAWRTVK